MNYLNKKTVEDIDVSGKRVLVRCDFNVPFDADGNITDPKRIDEALKTIRYLLDHKAKVILCSHLGRPKGEFNMKYSLAPVAAYLSKALGMEVKMAKDVVGESAKSLAAGLKDGEAMLIENVRFHKEEEKNDGFYQIEGFLPFQARCRRHYTSTSFLLPSIVWVMMITATTRKRIKASAWPTPNSLERNALRYTYIAAITVEP